MFSLAVLPLLFTSCKKDKSNEPDSGPNAPYTGDLMKDLNVPDGFNFSFSTKAQLDLVLKTQDGNTAKGVKYCILGKSAKGDAQQLSNGSSDEKDKLELNVEIPNHFEKVIVKTEFENTTRYFEYLVEEVIQGELIVDGFAEDGVEDRSGNCYPSSSITYSQDNKSFNITSDQTMSTIEVFYTDGTSETVIVNSTSFSF